MNFFFLFLLLAAVHRAVLDGTAATAVAGTTMDGNHMVNMVHTVNQLLKPLPTKDTIQMPAVVNSTHKTLCAKACKIKRFLK